MEDLQQSNSGGTIKVSGTLSDQVKNYKLTEDKDDIKQLGEEISY